MLELTRINIEAPVQGARIFISKDGATLVVNVDGRCVLRVDRMPNAKVMIDKVEINAG